ncbi:hypothetical protein FQR65_LT19973 [Abscondita terminalis]|nr:hypothetical protein FQR65_LT19973 [Abscondita terminalis]
MRQRRKRSGQSRGIRPHLQRPSRTVPRERTPARRRKAGRRTESATGYDNITFTEVVPDIEGDEIDHSGDTISIAVAKKGVYQDAGSKMIHLGGTANYRGLAYIGPNAVNSKARVECDTLILDNQSHSDTMASKLKFIIMNLKLNMKQLFRKGNDIDSFYSSVNIGNQIRKNGSTTDLVLELGGKDPALVLDDLKLEKICSMKCIAVIKEHEEKEILKQENTQENENIDFLDENQAFVAPQEFESNQEIFNEIEEPKEDKFANAAIPNNLPKEEELPPIF